MLKEIYVKNFAIVDDVNIQFTKGFNVLTGETGAGKTLIIEAINLLIGERADLELIRDGFDNLLVQGYFDFNGNESVLDFLLKEELIKDGFEASDIEITRELNRNGRNRVFVNGHFTQVSTLRNLGKLFIDIHGQHDHQYLLDKKYHLELIDKLGGNAFTELKDLYNVAYKEFLDKKEEINKLVEEQTKKDEYLKELKYKLVEIENLKLKPGEEEELENEKNILKNYEKIHQYSTECLSILNGGGEAAGIDFSLIFNSSRLQKILYEFVKVDKNISKYIEGLEGYSIVIEELNNYLNSFIQEFDFNPEKLEEIQERIFAINEIKRKYRMDIPEIINYMQKLREQVVNLEDIDSTISQKIKDFESSRNILLDKAILLHEQRIKICSQFENQIINELKELNFKTVKFKANLDFIEGEDATYHNQKIKFSPEGIDKCEFLISLNIGEDLKSLNKVASGGEISRIMLSLKSILGNADNIRTMIFDEIDSGIGGQTALIVGEKLYKISIFKQVMCITHLPQIASFADNHFLIMKYVEKSRTKINITSLNEKERINEISRMMSGEKQSDLSILHAEELIGQCKDSKRNIKGVF